MNSIEESKENKFRISDTRRASPRITPGLSLKSVHPPTMANSSHARRPDNFFDGSSDEEDTDVLDGHSPVDVDAANAVRASIAKKRRSGSYLGAEPDQFRSQCGAKRATEPSAMEPSGIDISQIYGPHGDRRFRNSEIYRAFKPLVLTSNVPSAHDSHFDTQPMHAASDRTFGSVRDESESFKDASHSEPPKNDTVQMPIHSSAAPGFEYDDDGVDYDWLSQQLNNDPMQFDMGEESPVLPKHDNSVIMGVHKMTLQALLRNEQGVNMNSQPMAPSPLQLPQTSKLRRSQGFRDLGHRSTSAPVRKVSVLPPPIDTSKRHHINPAEIVRTPYPSSDHARRKGFGSSPAQTANSEFPITEGLLVLSIRRNSRNRPIRSTTMILPATSDFVTLKAAAAMEKENHFRALDFDDAEFFRQLKVNYRSMMGPLYFLGARTLSRITISGNASRAADMGYGWLSSSQAPRTPSFGRPSDTFNEHKLLQQFRNPTRAKSRYAWVSWAHRLAAAPSTPVPHSARSGDSREGRVRRDPFTEQIEGLEFVLSWSVGRISAVLAVVIAVSIAAALIWIFLGTSPATQAQLYDRLHTVSQGGGFRDAGDRVTSGILLGICILIVGLTGMGGWLGVSWLVV